MLIILKQQMETLRQPAWRAFEDEMAAHLARFSPPLCRALGAEQLTLAIRFGVSRAAGHGFTLRGPVRLYLEAMLLFGSHFDTDPQYPWAANIISNPGTGSQMSRAKALYAEILAYRAAVTGPNDAHASLALRRIRELANQPPHFRTPDLVSAILREIERIYPQKAAYTGHEALEALIHDSIASANRHEFRQPGQVVVMLILMLAFGHGCTDDPLYPWIARTLRDKHIRDAQARADRLAAKSLTWLDHVLAYFDDALS